MEYPMIKIIKLMIFGLLGSIVFAINLSIDPPHYYLETDSHSVVRKTITIVNNDTSTAKVKVYLNDWFLNKGKKGFLPAGMTSYSLRQSLQIYPTEFELKPKQSKSVLLVISTTEAESGGKYGVVFFEAVPNKKTRRSGVQIGGRIGSMIYKEVKNTAVEDFEIDDFKSSVVGQKLFVKFRFKNDSNVYLNPKSSIVLVDNKTNKLIFKKEISTIAALPRTTHEGDLFFLLKEKVANPEDLSLMMSFDFGGDNVVLKEYSFKKPVVDVKSTVKEKTKEIKGK
jgi:hypothetical protein